MSPRDQVISLITKQISAKELSDQMPVSVHRQKNLAGVVANQSTKHLFKAPMFSSQRNVQLFDIEWLRLVFQYSKE